MQSLVIFLCLLVACLASPDKRIVNGNTAPSAAHPHQASLQLRYSTGFSHICGASLIARNKLVTAAHCVQGQAVGNLRIVVGTNSLSTANSNTQIVTVSRYVVHPNYNSNGAGIPNDIAIIYLSTSVTLNSAVQLATLAPAGATFANTQCIISGWGQTSGSGGSPTNLQEVFITKITNAACATYWGSSRITSNHICVFETSKPSGTRPSACNGDSGGPMMCGSNFDYLAGVTSWGVATCSGDYPSVYTRVSQYISWINAN